MTGQVKVACHCGAASLSVTPVPSEDGLVDITMCHCDSCRHVTGELFVSYMPISRLARSDLDGTSEYATADGWTRRFCATCGSHLFRTRGLGGENEWEVTTGVLTGPEGSANFGTNARYKRHAAVSDTLDGGSSVWLTEVDGQKMEASDSQDSSRAVVQVENPAGTLRASCACGTVALHITRPDETSLLPSSYLPDLTHAYCSTDPSIIANPTDTKWWLRPGGKYLAGTCACRSCRLVSGFEIQSWAFVPRSNIHFHVPNEGAAPLDFDTLPTGVLKSYASSPDVVREFCGKCGATVFWRGRLRPELLDVSVGLLRGEGARAEGWLDWWTERVSFSEDAETGRECGEARRGRALVEALETGLKAWAQRR